MVDIFMSQTFLAQFGLVSVHPKIECVDMKEKIYKICAQYALPTGSQSQLTAQICHNFWLIDHTSRCLQHKSEKVKERGENGREIDWLSLSLSSLVFFSPMIFLFHSATTDCEILVACFIKYESVSLSWAEAIAFPIPKISQVAGNLKM